MLQAFEPLRLSAACRCGAVRATVDASPVRGRRAGLHVVCYCDDCRAFARAVRRPDVLDEFGGTAIWQTTPARLRFDFGAQHLRCLRLSDKGMLRWHTACCNTPVANTMASPGMPFVGLFHAFLGLAPAQAKAKLGPATFIYGRSAQGDVSAFAEPKASLRTILRIVGFLLREKIAGAHRPSPLFDDAGQPVSSPRILPAAEREALRKLDTWTRADAR